ncbi:TetR/AcrR family transcriptional regulator [Mycolicibacterium baixiangningiae]|uniref:TetR/AcrR family transcriptional regulator n=1 Tax=Mycolicibacterium baixiangningiae TaxID=2761578 RepID=UPI00186622A4|nr:TetR/AcrR family transcriptional regulator [Mycolicibacterium baixiangningiae]
MTLSAPASAGDGPLHAGVPQPRGSRRKLLLDAAANLFLHHPYDSVTVGMVATEAGISGPGLYRHFQNKQALLIAVVEEGLQELHQFARATVDSEPDPRAALETIVDFHVRSVITDPPRSLIFLKNEYALPDAERRKVRREMNLYAQEWVLLVMQLRPDLSEPQARLLTQAVFSMLNSVATLNKGLNQEDIVATMSTAAIQALTSHLPGWSAG